MTEYQSVIDALPHENSTCCSCNEYRSRVVIKTSSDRFIPRYGCRWCEVRLIDILEEDSSAYMAVLRHPSDPAYDWLPDHMRKSGASAGFGYSLASTTPWRISRRYTIHNDHIWLVDGCMAIDSKLPSTQINEWRAKVDKDTNHQRAQIGLAKIMNPISPHKPVNFIDYDHRYKRFGNIAIDSKYLDFAMSVHPESQAFAVSGKQNQNPILFMNIGLTVAVVMPAWADFEKN